MNLQRGVETREFRASLRWVVKFRQEMARPICLVLLSLVLEGLREAIGFKEPVTLTLLEEWSKQDRSAKRASRSCSNSLGENGKSEVNLLPSRSPAAAKG